MIQIDYRDARPIYEQIVERYQFLILKNILEPGEKMPSVRQMAAELSINPNTIQRAYAMLEAEGYIVSVRGKGSFVAGSQALYEKKEQEWLGKLRGLLEEGKALGIPGQRCHEQVDTIYGTAKEEA